MKESKLIVVRPAKIAVIVFLGLLWTIQLHGQDFWQQTNGPFGGMTQALAINSSDNIFPGTFSGVVFRSAQATPTLPAAPANVVTSAGNESGFSNEVNARPSSSDLVQIAGGAFQMGNTTGQSNEIPVDSVTLSSFHIDETEITYEKWTDVRIWGLTHGYTDLVAGRNGYTGTTNHPVEE